MGSESFAKDQRGVSEIYGTVLVISLAFITALLLVAGGWFVIDQLTTESEDTLAQDAMGEMDGNLDSITGEQVNSSTTFEFPEGTGADVSTAPEEGKVTVNVTTNKSYQDLVAAYDGSSYDNVSVSMTLGTILHEDDNGVVTGYQGGGLWERHDGHTFVRSEPPFDFNGQALDFGFVNLSEMGSINEGQVVRAEHDVGDTQAQQQRILNEIAPHWNITGANATAPVSINVTIESQFADGWARYAEERMTAAPDDVIYPYEGDPEKVQIQFGEVPPSATFPTTTNFTHPILYAGQSQFAHKRYNKSHPTHEINKPGDGFEIDPASHSHHETAFYDETRGEWLILKAPPVANAEWVNTSGQTVYSNPEDPDQVNSFAGGPSGNAAEYEFEEGTHTCVVAENQISSTHPNGDGVLTEDPGTGLTLLELCAIEAYPDEAPRPTFDTTFEINITGTDPPAPDREVSEGDPIEVDVDVNNTGNFNDTQDVGLYYFEGDDTSNDPVLVDWKEDLELKDGESKTLDFNWNDTDADVNASGSEVDLYAVGENDFDVVTVNVTSEEPQFDVDITNATDTATEGEEVEVTAEINNSGDADGSQIVYLQEPDGKIADSKEVALDAGKNKKVNLTWKTTSGDAISDGQLTVQSDDDDDATNVTVFESGSAGEPRFIVDIEKDFYQVDFEDDTANLNVDVENVGNASGTQDIGLFNFDGALVDVSEVKLDPGKTKTVKLVWAPDEEYAGETDTVKVASADDSDTATVDVNDSIALESFFKMDIRSVDDPVEEGKPLNVDARIENTGGIKDTQLIALYDVDGNVVDVREFTLEANETTTRNLTWSDPADLDPEADNEIAVRSEDDGDTQSVDIASQLLVRAFEAERDADGTVTVENVKVENVGDEELKQDIELLNYNGSNVSSFQTGKIEPGETKTFTNRDLEWSDSPERTGNITVTSEDDALEQRILVERDGPECDTVSYDIDSDGYRKVETVDQLQCIEFADATHDTRKQSLQQNYRLYNDIDAYGTQFWNDGDGFVPIGAQEQNEEYEFAGDFDGQGNKIEGLHIDRMDESFVGIFASTNYFDAGQNGDVGAGSTVGSVRLVDIDVRGKTVVGGLVAAAGGTVENASVDGYVESEYQQVGGLVGHGHDADLNNRLVSRATVIGSYPACADNEHPWQNSHGNLGVGGIVGGTGFNTDVATAYSLATVRGASAVGGITGWTSDYSSENLQMYWAAGELELKEEERVIDEDSGCDRSDLDDDPNAGAIAGRMEIEDDNFRDSVYWDRAFHPHGNGEQKEDADPIPRTTENMTGLDVKTPDKVGNLTFQDEGGPWVAVPDDYPRFFWELEAEGAFIPTITDTDSPVSIGNELEVDVAVQNTNPEEETQTVVLLDPNGNPVDTEEVTIPGEIEDNPSKSIELAWDTDSDDGGEGEITVTTEDALDAEFVDVQGGEDDDAPDSEFRVDIDGTNSPVDAGDDLDVNVTIENAGNESDEQTIYLTDPTDSIVGSIEVDLEPGEMSERTITWETDAGDADEAPQEITVHTDDDTDSDDVSIEEAGDTDEPNFEITNVEPFDPVEEGETLDVEVTVNNTGGAEGTQYVVLAEGNDFPPILDQNKITLEPGEERTFDLTWETQDGDGDTDPQEISVHTEDDSTTKDVTVKPSDAAEFQVDITDTNSPVTVGEQLNLTVQVENVGDANGTQYIYLEHPTDSSRILDIQEVTLDEQGGSDDSTEIELQWSTTTDYEGDITVRSEDDFDRERVAIEVDSSTAVGGGINSPIDVNLEQVRIS